ncbi:MAG: hypothetical protein J5736_00085, partial [Bacilli bacterium]|nr:hypothetical protein [Bacilli bacterium]
YSDEPFASEEALLCFKYPKAVLALSSAFYLQGLSDTPPESFVLATSRDAAKIKDPRVRQLFLPEEILFLGVSEMGRHGDFRVYDLERCAVDLLRYKSKFPYEYYKEVLRNLRASLPKMDIRLMQDYMERMPKSGLLMKRMMEELL